MYISIYFYNQVTFKGEKKHVYSCACTKVRLVDNCYKFSYQRNWCHDCHCQYSLIQSDFCLKFNNYLFPKETFEYLICTIVYRIYQNTMFLYTHHCIQYMFKPSVFVLLLKHYDLSLLQYLYNILFHSCDTWNMNWISFGAAVYWSCPAV